MLKTIAAGDRLVVETLCTNSWVDVVWQVLDWFNWLYLVNRFASFYVIDFDEFVALNLKKNWGNK